MEQTINSAKFNRSDLYWLIAAIIATITVIVAIEIAHPYFFLNDDNADSYICQYAYTLRAISHGEFPFYNFNEYMGYEFFAQGQVGVLNPFMYLAAGLSKLFLGSIDGTIDFMAALLIVFGTVGAFLLIRKLTGSPEASAIASLGWTLNSFNIYVSNCWIIVMITTAFFSWMLYSMILLIEKPSLKRYLLTMVIHAMSFWVSGHPQFYIYSVIFEFIFALGFFKLRKTLQLIKHFALTYLGVFLLCFPVLLAMYNFMQKSSDRSGKIDIIDVFLSHTMLSFVGIFYPYSPKNGFMVLNENLQTETAYGFNEDIQKNLCFIGYALLVLFFIGLFFFIRDARTCLRKHKSTPLLKRDGFILLCILIAIAWSTSYLFNSFVYMVPLLNRFRYPFKLMLFAPLFMSITAGITLARIFNNKASHKATISVIFVGLTLINYGLLYVLLPVRCISIPLENNAVPYTDAFVEELSYGRYVNIMSDGVYYDVDHNHNPVNFPAILSHNMASYYGINDRFGYLLLKTEATSAVDFDLYNYASGSVNKSYDGFIDDMRDTSVNWYITVPENEEYASTYLSPYGITKVYSDDQKVVFYDSLAKPIVYTGNGENTRAIDYTQHTNYVEFSIDSSFAGGDVYATYNKNPDLHLYVDGIETKIEGDNAITIPLEAGSHNVVIRYESPTIIPSLIISASGIIVYAASYYFYNRKHNNTLRKKTI